MADTETDWMADLLVIHLFGPFEVQRNGIPLARFRSRKVYQLLALLALRHKHPTDRSWLAGILWPESPETQARAGLRDSLKDLRRALGSEAGRLYAPTPRTLRLDLSAAAVDLLEFDAAMARGDEPSLEHAVSLYRGPLLEGWTEEWVFQERHAREQAYLGALITLAERSRARARHEQAVYYLRRAIVADPLYEHAHRALMETLSESQNYAAAVQVYRELRLLLHHELNAEPDPATVAVFQQIRMEARVRAAVSSPPRAAVSSAPPPLRIPQPLTALIGRQEECGQILTALAAARLVTLTGVGGIGKTRLAIHVAGEAAADYDDGAGFIELADLDGPRSDRDGTGESARLNEAVATRLGVVLKPGCQAIEALVAWLRPKQFLLVLDNCEHLVEPCAKFVDFLLRECPHLRILTTSRQALGLIGERVVRVPPLFFPASRASRHTKGSAALTPEALISYEAVQLFVERATAVEPNFRLTVRNAAAVGQLCRRVEGIPLAIELAAAWLKALSVEEIAARLDDRFRLLTGGSRAAAPRQQTLRASIDWSYDLLTEPERALLRRLSVFAGGWTLEAAEAVCGNGGTERCPGQRKLATLRPVPQGVDSDDILELLAHLVEKSLVVHEVRSEAPRYRLLETVREYARDRLRETAEEEVIRDRHFAFFRRLAAAEQGLPELLGYAPLERWNAERDNVQTALQWGVERDPLSAIHLATAVGHQWVFAFGEELAEPLQRAVQCLEDRQQEGAGPSRPEAAIDDTELVEARAKALLWMGTVAFLQGEHERAQYLLEESLSLSRLLGDKRGTAHALRALGGQARYRGDRETAWALYEESLSLYQESGDRQGIAEVLGGLGKLAQTVGDYAMAAAFHEERLAISREIGHEWGIAAALQFLAWIAAVQGRFDQAQKLAEQSLMIYRAFAASAPIGALLGTLGWIARAHGDLQRARTLFQESLALSQETSNREGISAALIELGGVACLQNDEPEARAFLEQGLVLAQGIRNQGLIIRALQCLAGLASSCGEDDKARTLLRDSLTLALAIGDRPGVINGLTCLAQQEVSGRAGSRAEWAARLLGAAEAGREALGTPVPPVEREAQERTVAVLRRMLGEEAFATSWAEGRVLTIEKAGAMAKEL